MPGWAPSLLTRHILCPDGRGPALSYGFGTTLVAGTGYQYTHDLTDGVPALSTAPIPIERWFYQNGSPYSANDGIEETSVGGRANYWIAYKYGLDETVPSVGDPNPVAPAPGGVWGWMGNYWELQAQIPQADLRRRARRRRLR